MKKLGSATLFFGFSLSASLSFSAGMPILIDRFSNDKYLNEAAANYALGTAVSDTLAKRFPDTSYMFKVVSGGGMTDNKACVYSVILAIENKNDKSIVDLVDNYGYITNSNIKDCRGAFAKALHDEGVTLSNRYR